jgi:hypothetical protein
MICQKTFPKQEKLDMHSAQNRRERKEIYYPQSLDQQTTNIINTASQLRYNFSLVPLSTAAKMPDRRRNSNVNFLNKNFNDRQNFSQTPILSDTQIFTQSKKETRIDSQFLGATQVSPSKKVLREPNTIQLASKTGIYYASESENDSEGEEKTSEGENDSIEELLEQRYPTRFTYQNTKEDNELSLANQGPHSQSHVLKKEHHRKILDRGKTEDLVKYARSVTKSEEAEKLSNELLDENKRKRYIEDYKEKEENLEKQIEEVEEKRGSKEGVDPSKKQKLLEKTSELQEMHPLATYGKTAGGKALKGKGEYEGVIAEAASEADDEKAARIIEQDLDRGAAVWNRIMGTEDAYKDWLEKSLKLYGVRDKVIDVILTRQAGQTPNDYADPDGKRAEKKKKNQKKKKKHPFG